MRKGRGEGRHKDERRERIRLRDLLSRRARQQEQQEETLEPLDPASARARYREFLQSLANQEPALARRAMETPTEYQRRLQEALVATPVTTEEQTDLTQIDAAVLYELTMSYKEERYGGKKTVPPPSESVAGWISSIVSRLRKAAD